MENSKKIKLFIDAHSFDKEFQGVRTFIKEIYFELSKLTDGIEYYIGAHNIDNLKKEFKGLPNCHFIKYRCNSTLYRLCFEIPNIIKKHKIDLAHFQYIVSPIKNCKYIVTTHDILFNDFPEEFSLLYKLSRNLLFKYSLLKSDIKTTVSGYSRDRIEKHYKIDKKNIFILPNGVSSEYFEEYNKKEVKNYISEKYNIKNYILYVSRIEPRKNQSLLLDTYLKLELYKKNISLVFIGKKSIESQKLTQLIEGLPFEALPYFKFIEQVNHYDLLKFYQACEVFVYPSKAEGFGIPPLEAAALTIPVICSNQTAMSDFLFFGDNFFNPNNEEELIEKIENVLFKNDNKANYEWISKQINEKYSWKNSAEKLLLLIEKEFTNGNFSSLNKK